jgi:hypothetical protein
MNTTNEMQLYRSIYCSYSALHVSVHVFAHDQDHLTIFTASGVMEELERNQPAATMVSITRCCKYSQVLLIMGENIARNIRAD